MEEKEQKNLIFNVAMFTASVVALLIVVACALLAIFSPLTYANFITAIGFKNAGLISYAQNYSKTEDIDDLYLLINKSISASNYEYQIRYIPELLEKDNYLSFVQFVQTTNIAKCSSKLQLLYIANEDNYLKSKYVYALCHNNMKQQALEFALDDLSSSRVDILGDRVNFVLSAYIDCLKESEYITLSSSVSSIYDYYLSLCSLYNEQDIRAESVTELSRFYTAILASKMIDVGNALIKLDWFDSEQVYVKADIEIKIRLLKSDVNYYCFNEAEA